MIFSRFCFGPRTIGVKLEWGKLLPVEPSISPCLYTLSKSYTMVSFGMVRKLRSFDELKSLNRVITELTKCFTLLECVFCVSFVSPVTRTTISCSTYPYFILNGYYFPRTHLPDLLSVIRKVWSQGSYHLRVYFHL